MKAIEKRYPGVDRVVCGTPLGTPLDILVLATGNVGNFGNGANIFRGHCNVQGATDLGLDVVTLPLYYGLTETAWKHWVRVWDVDYNWLLSRFDSKQIMETPGIPSTRWFDAAMLPRDQVAQKDNLRAMIVFGHGGNTITRMPQAAKGIEKAAQVNPTASSVKEEQLFQERDRISGRYTIPDQKACTIESTQ